MKTNMRILPIIVGISSIMLHYSCSKHDHSGHDHDVIHRIDISLVSDDNEHSAKIEYTDHDGDGGNPPTIKSDTLRVNKKYNASIRVYNHDSEITSEVETQGTAHQFFLEPSDPELISIIYTDEDTNKNPIGLKTKWIIQKASINSATLKVILRHNPKKPNTGSADAGGDSDIEITVPLNIKN